jgi:WD40 repeat protein
MLRSPFRALSRALIGVVLFAGACALALSAPPEPVELRPNLVLKGHQNAVYSVAFSPNGALIATGSFDQSVKLWDAKSGKEVRAFSGAAGHQNLVLNVAFSPNGESLTSCGSDNTARIWDVPTSAPVREFVNPSSLRAMAVTPDGKLAAGAGQDGAVDLWTIADGKPAGKLAGHTGGASALAFSANGQLLLSGGADGAVRSWNPAAGQAIAPVGAHAAPVTGVALNPTATTAFSIGEDGFLKWWKLPGVPARSLTAHAGAVNALFLSTDGNALLSAGADKIVKSTTTAVNPATRDLTGADSVLQAVASGGNPALMAAAGADGKVFIWKAGDGKLLAQFSAHRGGVNGVAFHPSQPLLATVGADGALKTWALPTMTPKEAPPAKSTLAVHAGGAVGVAFNPNGTQVITAGKDKMVRLRDLASGKELKSFGPLPGPIVAMSVSRDFAVVAVAAGKLVKAWQIADGKELTAIEHPAEVLALAFNADRSRLVTGAVDNLARVWEVATGNLVQSFRQEGAIRGVAFHPSQPVVYTASADKSVQAHALTLMRQVAASKQPLRAVLTTPNNTHVITAGDDKNVKAWNANTGADERTFAGAEGPVDAVAIAKNGALVAAGGADKVIRLYTFNDAKQIGTIAAPAVVRGLAFHPTQPIVVAACDNGSVNAWNVAFQPGQPIPAEFGKPIQSFAHAGPPVAAAFADQGALFTASADKSIKQWRIAADAPVRNFAHPALVDCVAFDPAGKLLATGCHDGLLRIFDIEKNAPIKSINAHLQTQPEARGNPIYVVAWTADGKQVLTASYDKSLKLWDAASGNLVREFKPFADKAFPQGHRDQIFTAVFAPDGQTIATGSSDKSIKIWKVTDGTVVREFANPNLSQLPPPETPDAHPGWVYALRFTADGKRLISAGSAARNRGYLAVWNVADGKMLYGEEVANGPIYSVALAKDGQNLLLGCGPRDRQDPVSEALLVPMPVK